MKKVILIIILNFLIIPNLIAQIYPSSTMPNNFALSGIWIREAVIDGNTGLGAYFLFDKDSFSYYLSSSSDVPIWSGKYKLNSGQITFVIQKHLGLLIPKEKIAVYDAWILKKDTDNREVVGISFSYGLILEASYYFMPSHFKK
jgi:hypothetical protein